MVIALSLLGVHLRCDTNPNLKPNAVLCPLKLIVSDDGDSVWNASSLDSHLPKNADIHASGPWGLSKNTSGFSDTLPNSINYTRKGYFQGLLSFDSACERIKARRNTSSYIFFEITKDDGSTEIVKSKAAVRGNDVYRARVWNRHKDLLSFCEVNDKISYIVPDKHGYHCNVLKATLTVNPKGRDRDDYNSNSMNHHYDLYVKRIRNQFPGVVVAKTLEVNTKKIRGWFHINVIMLFPDDSFPVYQHTSKLNTHRKNGHPIKSWRLKHYSSASAVNAGKSANISKEFFADAWDCGYVDVRAISGPRDLAEYTLKYHIKNFTDKKSHETQELTFSALSLYNKRCFSFPNASAVRGTRGFTDTVINHTVELEGQTVNFPELDIISHNSLECRFLGHYLDVHDNFNGNLWFEIVDRPPTEIDKGFFGTYSLGLPVDTISTCDSGFRWVDGLRVQLIKNPDIERSRLLGNSKKYSHLKELHEETKE
ncbi:unnamed protein product [marine sediment metagenome]|uniref:Uncharacterized protein n=1 Tax=marine sediment metagenome TaxID=412755 RepID=X1KW02_9ZZZZ